MNAHKHFSRMRGFVLMNRWARGLRWLAIVGNPRKLPYSAAPNVICSRRPHSNYAIVFSSKAMLSEPFYNADG